jgi:hypothetical protein
MNTITFDLETTGLDPRDGFIRCFGVIDRLYRKTMSVELCDDWADEMNLVSSIVSTLQSADVWRGWNISEFDLWWLHERCAEHDIEFPVEETGEIGKYGKPRLRSPWARVEDLAYWQAPKQAAERLGVKHSLQPLAAALGRPTLVALGGGDMPTASLAGIGAHCLDDLEAVEFIASYDFSNMRPG